MFKVEYMGEFVTVSDDLYLEWLNTELEKLYEMDWESSPALQSTLEFFENELAECRHRLGLSGKLR